MPIYDIFERKEQRESGLSTTMEPFAEERFAHAHCESEPTPTAAKDRFFTSLASRLFFLLLLVADLLWALYAVASFLVITTIALLSFSKITWFVHARAKGWIAVKRSLVCALSLFVALFSPAFGIMVACTYFLMYDKTAIEEIVPSSLQDQFKEFFKSADV